MGALTFRDIRHEFVRILKAAAIPGVLDKVYESRAERGFPSEGPFISVYTNNHNFDDQGTSPVVYKIETSVIVDIIVQGPVVQVLPTGARNRINVDDQMDVLTDKVINALLYAPVPARGPLNIGTDHFVRLGSVVNTLNGQGETDKACQRLTFTVTWECALPDGGPENDMNVIHNELDTSDGDGSKKMVWEITRTGT